MASKEYYDLVAQKLALHKENVKRGKELKGLETVRNRAIRPFTSRKVVGRNQNEPAEPKRCLLYTSPSPRDLSTSRMPSSA